MFYVTLVLSVGNLHNFCLSEWNMNMLLAKVQPTDSITKIKNSNYSGLSFIFVTPAGIVVN